MFSNSHEKFFLKKKNYFFLFEFDWSSANFAQFSLHFVLQIVLVLVTQPSLRVQVVVVVVGARDGRGIPQLVQRRLFVQHEGLLRCGLDLEHAVAHRRVFDRRVRVQKFVRHDRGVLDEHLADVVVLGGVGQLGKKAAAFVVASDGDVDGESSLKTKKR